jgi:hypothetical protein
MNNLELELALADSVRRERSCLAEVLKYLREVEKRRLYLERGYSSLFAYCTGKLGYSEPEAMLRIQAMRLMRAVPEAAKKIEEGKLSLSVAAKIQSAVKEAPEKEKELVRELSGASKREAEKKLAEVFPQEVRPEKARPVNENKVEIRFTVTREEYELFQKLMDRKAHANFERKYEQLFTALAKAELKKLEGKQTEDALPHGPDEVKSRHIPAVIKRKVWRRDEGRCQYRSPGGHPCNEQHGLQLDHIKPFAQGGATTEENLRLLCGAHNRWRNSG